MAPRARFIGAFNGHGDHRGVGTRRARNRRAGGQAAPCVRAYAHGFVHALPRARVNVRVRATIAWCTQKGQEGGAAYSLL